MNQDNCILLCEHIENAFQKITSEMDRFEFSRCEEQFSMEGRKFLAIIGIVGHYKGRMHIEMGEELAHKLYEHMNGEPVDEEMDLCFYLAEFTNILTGNGITDLNNAYQGINLRLTPPAVFVGDNLDVMAPEVPTASMNYQTNYGEMRIEIGLV